VPPVSLTRSRGAVGLRLLILGILDAAWWSQIALVKHDLRLGAAGLSLALAGAPVGLLTAVRIVPPLVARSSSATVLRWAVRVATVSVVVIGLARGVLALAAALVVFGVCNGVIDVTVNVQAVALERLSGRAIMSRLHAMWSLGTLLGALAGAGAIGLGATPLQFFVAVAVLIAGLSTVLSRALLGPVADAPRAVVADGDGGPPGTAVGSGPRPRLRGRPGLIALGVIAFCGLFAEGSVSNWGGVMIHQVRHASFTVAALVTAGFGAGMLIGRLTGDAAIERLGRRPALIGAAASGAVVLCVAVLVPSVAVSVSAFVVLGALLATIVPSAFSLSAGVTGVPPAWTISQLTTVGYAGSFVSPVLIGLVAGLSQLTVALLIPAALLLLVWPAAQATRGRLAVVNAD
jgi:hypothetical protein